MHRVDDGNMKFVLVNFALRVVMEQWEKSVEQMEEYGCHVVLI